MYLTPLFFQVCMRVPTAPALLPAILNIAPSRVIRESHAGWTTNWRRTIPLDQLFCLSWCDFVLQSTTKGSRSPRGSINGDGSASPQVRRELLMIIKFSLCNSFCHSLCLLPTERGVAVVRPEAAAESSLCGVSDPRWGEPGGKPVPLLLKGEPGPELVT